MNLAIGLTAARYGTAMANYTEVVSLLKTSDPTTGTEKVCGARCRDVLTGEGGCVVVMTMVLVVDGVLAQVSLARILTPNYFCLTVPKLFAFFCHLKI